MPPRSPCLFGLRFLHAHTRLLAKNRARSIQLLTEPYTREEFVKVLGQQLRNEEYRKAVYRRSKDLKHVFNELRTIVSQNEKLSHGRLCAIGSLPCSSLTPTSDLDLLFIPFANDDSARTELFGSTSLSKANASMKLLSRLRKISSSLCENHPCHFRARIPLVQGKFGSTRSGVKFDIQVNGPECIRSTYFVRAAFKIEPRLVKLHQWLRIYFDRNEVYGGIRGYFTAFHLYMLCIFYAQKVGLLPRLMDEYAVNLNPLRPWAEIATEMDTDAKMPETAARQMHPMKNTEVGEIVLDFLHFYRDVDFSTQGLSIATSKFLTKTSSKRNAVLIVDPYHHQKEGVCKVKNGSELLNQLFERTSARVKNQEWKELLLRN